MGLDVFFVDPEDPDEWLDTGLPEPDLGEPTGIVGGMMSGHGKGSFRGKVYDSFVRDHTGYSLYDNLSNDEVTDIANALDGLDPDDIEFDRFWHPDDSEEFEAVRAMFRHYADVGAETAAWY